MDEQRTRGGVLATALAVGALALAAVPAYGALSGDSSENGSPAPGSAPGATAVQDSQERQDRPDRPDRGPGDDDCPFKDGQRSGGDNDGSGGGSGGSGGGSGSTPETAF